MALGGEVRLSIVIPVYQSHDALRRQALYWRGLGLPDDVEIIIADDNSTPPLEADGVQVVRTGNRLAWTSGLARNLGVDHATGENLLMTDIDHILSPEAIEASRQYEGARLQFPRYFGVLLEDGTFTDDVDVLVEYGFNPKRLKTRGLYASFHGNTFTMPRRDFLALGGYAEKDCTLGYHPGKYGGEDTHFNARWNRWAKRRGLRPDRGPAIYMFPVGRYHVDGETNPMGLFHDLSYEKRKMWKNGDPD